MEGGGQWNYASWMEMLLYNNIIQSVMQMMHHTDIVFCPWCASGDGADLGPLRLQVLFQIS